MPSEAPSKGPTALSPRAAVARLTLQLRASLQEAATAESGAAAVDQDAALTQLRARLAPLLDARRRALDEELEQVRTEAQAAIATAQREAATIISGATTPVEVAIVATAAAPAIVAAPIEPVELTPIEPVAWAPIEPITLPITEVTVVPNAAEPTNAVPPAEGLTQVLPGLPPINVVIDAEAFARVFATVFVTVLNERASAWPVGVSVATQALMPAKQKTPLRHARHLDVFLLGLATVIVLVILASWLA